MVTTFKDHSTAEIQKTIEAALGQLFGSPVRVSIGKVAHHTPGTMERIVSNSMWSADLELHIADFPPEMDEDEPF